MLTKKGQPLAHYRLVEQIGEGGMGIVWRAWDEHLDRDVAIKVLPPGALADEGARRRFHKEARALSRVNHANIATVHDFDTQDDLDFLVMEYVPGVTLSDRLGDGPLTVAEVLQLGIQLLEGLAAAHDQGILHRDLKPGNLRVTPDEQLKILDFGLAKRIRPIGPDDPTETMTRAGVVVGTLAYMAPEQLRGEKVDERTDIYAAGAVLYELATGVRMHPESDSVQLIDGILHGTPKPPRELRAGFSAELEKIILKSTARDPEARHSSARELRGELMRLSRPSREPFSQGQHRSSRRLVTGISVLALVMAVALTAWLAPMFLGERAPPVTAPGRLKIVIMPFENLGPPEHAYFADGVTEEIASRLAAVGSLGVISRKSAVQYARSDKTIRQIGEELGVSYVLAGTVRWAPGAEGRDRVKICPQLVRVADDTHVWARTYDQMIDDIFDVQASIARRVVQQLGIALQGSEQAAVEIRPTESLDAYHAFLRGLHHASQPHFTTANWERVLENFQRAVAIDPDFAGAWSKLTMAHARYYYYQADTSDARKRMAREAADRAVDLAPEAAETHMAIGYYYHWVERDGERALEEFALAEHGLPSDAEVLHARGTLLQAMGRWTEAREMMERAHALSPRDAGMIADLVFLYYPTRQYAKAMEFSERIIDLAPGGTEQAWGYLGKTFVHWSWKGELPEARAALEEVPLDHDFALWAWFWQEMYEGRYRQALEHLELAPEGWIRHKIVARPAELLAGLAWDAMGDAGRSRAAHESALVTLEQALEEDPDDPRLHSSLGIALAALGREEDAIREGVRAVDLYPLSRDAFYGIPYVLDMAHIYTLAGKHDAACERLELLLSVPSWLSPNILKIDPRWDRLRDQRSFQKLIEGPPPGSHQGKEKAVRRTGQAGRMGRVKGPDLGRQRSDSRARS